MSRYILSKIILGPGPDKWGGSCNTGTFQSPINIESKNATEVEEKQFIFHGYDVTPKKAELANNGHAVEIILESRQRISVYIFWAQSFTSH